MAWKRILETLREYNFDTSWSDNLIADKFVAEKPPTDLAVVIRSVYCAHTDFTLKSENFITCLERGQQAPLDPSEGVLDFISRGLDLR